ncbi:NADPH-dependent F420 reductase [Haloarcula japonica]|uniref:NADPH-dependent F420 reductase n=1 Tax=Haloarcula japonica (strain ATCC 49778 / DSM 6131 / JCM 7785 / NBRC 101032 / NCIMB 13157 / TR-1) TaxID=1227453 RepID=M0LM54_HALJT|nr:NADPH-dependent F420 reductase [Haloarcula japonica]EMA33524.1 NADPH-dependent F420 reductase [Haloarcula japonica DSM 6131]
MDIALLGGTGDIGQGLALRWADDTNHRIIIGSRKAEKAANKAEEYETELASRGHDDVEIAGLGNEEAAARADVVVAAVPAYHLTDTIDAVADELDDTTLVSPAVGMQRDEDGFHYNRPGAGSVTQLAANAAPDDTPVVGAFHNLAAGRLANLDADLDWDTIVVGDDTDAKDTVCELAEGIEGIRALDGGPLANAAEIEGLTPLLINVARHNDSLHDLGVRFQ